MAAANGKFELTNVEGLLAFCEAIKSPEKYQAEVRGLESALKANPSICTEEMHYDSGKFQRKVFIKGELQRDHTLTVGEENDVVGPDGRPIKMTATIESDNKAVFHGKGAGFEFTVTIEISGSTLSITSRSGSVTSVSTYKKL